MKGRKRTAKLKKVKSMKRLSATIAIILFATLLISALGKPANSDQVFNAWGALQNGSSPWEEYVYESSICDFVVSVMPGNVIATSFYYFGTNPDNVYYAIQDSQANQDQTDTLWVGDFAPQTPYAPPQLHWSFFSGYGYSGQYSWDSWIYYYSHTNNVQRSQFIWTCSCGGLYFDTSPTPIPSFPTTSTNPKTEYGWYDSSRGIAIGMPYAWTGTLTMNKNGYSSSTGSHTYIGWECTSPFLTLTAPGSGTQQPNYNFLYWYYYYATGQQDSQLHNVHDSLDFASQKIWGQNTYFDQTSYYNGWPNEQDTWTRMRVFGNSNNLVV